MTRLFFLLTILLILSGCTGTTTAGIVEADIYTSEQNLFVDLTIDTELPEGLQNNLEMYSLANISCQIKVARQENGAETTVTISRVIQYDRWNSIYLIVDTGSARTTRYSDFQTMLEHILVFRKVPLNIERTTMQEPLSLVIDCTVKSTNFAPPFNLIEDDFRFGNMRILQQVRGIVISDGK